MIQVFQAATTKEEYLTNMAKLILAVEIQDLREVRKFCGDWNIHVLKNKTE